jgi:hypothetical protein
MVPAQVMTKRTTPIDDFGPYIGYWTELVFAHNWPPMFRPREDWGRNAVANSLQAATQREAQVALGRNGTIVGMSEKSDARLKSVREPAKLIPRRA